MLQNDCIAKQLNDSEKKKIYIYAIIDIWSKKEKFIQYRCRSYEISRAISSL